MGTCWARFSALALLTLLLASPAWAAGQLILESNPPGASVDLNGQPIGETPLLRDGLPAGSHQVTITRPGYAPMTVRIIIENDLTTRQRVTLRPQRREAMGELVIESTPSGADVTLNGRWLGKTPLNVPVPAGMHRLSLRHPGYEAQTRKVRVVSDLTTSQRLTLVAIAPEPPVAALPPETPAPSPDPTATPKPIASPTPKPSPVSSPRPSPDSAAPRGLLAIRPEKTSPPSPHPLRTPRPLPTLRSARSLPPSAKPAPPAVTESSASTSPDRAELRLPRLPEAAWESLVERARHAGFSLMMLGFVATLGHALWRQRGKPVEWHPDMPSAGWRLLPGHSEDLGGLAAQATLSAIRWAEIGNSTKTLAELRDAFRHWPSSETAYNMALGWELAGMADWAELAYRTALYLEPGHRDAGINLANLLVPHEQYLDAWLLYRSLAELHAADGAIAFNRGNLLAAMGELDAAIQELKRARRLLPSDAAPRANLNIARRRRRATFWARALRRGRRPR